MSKGTTSEKQFYAGTVEVTGWAAKCLGCGATSPIAGNAVAAGHLALRRGWSLVAVGRWYCPKPYCFSAMKEERDRTAGTNESAKEKA